LLELAEVAEQDLKDRLIRRTDILYGDPSAHRPRPSESFNSLACHDTQPDRKSDALSRRTDRRHD